MAHVTKFRAEAGVVDIEAVFGAMAVENVHGVFLFAHIKIVECIFGIEDMVANAVFVVVSLHGDARKAVLEFDKFRRRRIEIAVILF